MKAIKFVFGVFMVLALISGSVAIAQEVEPPDISDIETFEGEPDLEALERDGHDIFNLELPERDTWPAPAPDLSETKGTTDNGQFVEEPQQPPPMQSEDLTPFTAEGDSEHPQYLGPPETEYPEPEADASIDRDTDRVIQLATDWIPVATDFTEDESSPAIAHGDGLYMVVYLVDGDVYGAVFHHDGRYATGGLVYDGPSPCSNLTVAYESKSGYFIVAFQYLFAGTDDDIRAIAVSPVTGPEGALRVIAEEFVDEKYPSLACNGRTGSCLVAYYKGTSHPIQGRFIYTDSSGINNSSINPYPLDFWNADYYKPYLAWGQDTNTYLLTYTYYHGAPHFFNIPIYTRLHDIYVVGDQYIEVGHSIVTTTWSTNNKISLGVTFDPCTNKYLVLWRHFHPTTGYDIWMRIVSSSSALAHGMGVVAATTVNEYAGDINFVRDAHVPATCGLTDRVVVTYKKANDGVYATDLRGNSNPSSPDYAWDAASQHLLIASDTSGVRSQYNPVIASGMYGKMFIAWESYWYWLITDYSVWGRMVQVYWPNFLPLVTR